jgi:hypothetical protein
LLKKGPKVEARIGFPVRGDFDGILLKQSLQRKKRVVRRRQCLTKLRDLSGLGVLLAKI